MPAKIKFSKEQKNTIISEYQKDKTPKEISNMVGTSITPIIRILKEENIFKPSCMKLLSYEAYSRIKTREECEKLYKSCITLSDFSDNLNCGIDMARSILNFHKIDIISGSESRRLKKYGVVDEKSIVRDYTELDLPIYKLTKKYNCAKETVLNILEKNKVSILNSHEKILSKRAKRALNDKIYAREIHAQCISKKEMCEALSCSPQTVDKIISLHSLKKYTTKSFHINSWNKKFDEKFENFEIVYRNGVYFRVRHNSCGNEFELTQQSFRFWSGDDLCPKCNNRFKTSKFENEVKEFLLSVGMDIVENNRSILPNNLELDILIPSKNIAIECCGLYWHSSIFKDSNYHLNKLKMCKDKNISLLTIFEDEWENNRTIVENRIKNLIGISPKIIGGRECDIIKIERGRAIEFIKNNHLQGNDRASHYYALTHEDKIVSVMSFRRPNASTGNNDPDPNVFEISRFCSSLNVIGGASKLLKKFIKDNSPKKIITFSDRRWSEGKVYKKIGFNFIKETVPNYWYTKGANRLHRYTFTKHKLMEHYPEYKNMSERRIMEKLGYLRIYDCGSNKYELTI